MSPSAIQPPIEPGTKIPIGISSCLLGHEVRYDGGHKRNHYVTDVLARHFEFVMRCPEVDIGLGTPRPSIQLSQNVQSPRLVEVTNKSVDYTDQMLAYANAQATQCGSLSGYIFKRGSPSCAIERVRVYPRDGGAPLGVSPGLFARAVLEAWPLLPCEDEGRLNDPGLRENFVLRVFAYRRWQELVTNPLSAPALLAFHTQHKFLLLAQSESHYRIIGPLLANAGKADLNDLASRYISAFMSGLREPSTRASHANVLQHIAGFLKTHVDPADKAELASTIYEYQSGHIPLVVPVRLLRHHFRKHPTPYAAIHAYLSPYPDDLGLRNGL